MKVYLDIYGTVLKHEGFTLKPTNHLKEFLENALENHQVFWLSTHCNGDTAETLDYLSRYLSPDLMNLARVVNPTSWQRYKTEAINLAEDFIWFDDTLNPYDKRILEEEAKMDSFVHVKLHKNPDILAEYLEI